MGTINSSIIVSDSPAPDIFADLLEMEVEEDHRMASIFRIRISIHREDQGTWTYLDDERLKLWAKIEVKVAVGDDTTSLIQGYLTQMNVHIDSDENSSYLELKGMDASCLMNLEEKIKDWPNQSDSDIATQIISNYPGLTAQADDTSVIHDDKVSTIIQRDTDMQFLKRLARRNGYECVVRGDTVYFQKPPLTATPLPVLAAHFGADTNLYSFEARVNAMKPAQVEMHQVDTLAKTTLDASATPTQQQLGQNGAASLSPPGAQSKLVVRHEISTNAQEMSALCQALYDEAEWLVEASGEVDSAIYGSVLQSRNLVPVKGVGELFSGMYYLTNVKHMFNVEHYTQQFKARRNAMAPNDGDFGGGGLGLPF
jgi:phage protein D